ncbi:SUMO peptidase family member deneddylase 1 [Arctopsyche grandis]|uniref:SUMO peptidase family member deneddylase 1 n=1 Tax=Arctopsyche grandis TaxID=121162 RepID=UPI00406D6754
MSKMPKESNVLSFHDTILRKSDIDILKGPYWLNDTIISFYFEFLEKIVYKNDPNLLFVSPEVTQCMKMLSEDEVGLFLDPLGIRTKKFIFFALNDNEAAGSCGGSHWSLFIYSQPEDKYFHVDSCNDLNFEQAEILQHNVAHYLSNGAPIGNRGITSLDCLQQINGYDCGIHVLCNVDLIAKHVKQTNGIMPLCPKAEAESVRNKRCQLLVIISELVQNQRS